jgi:hypothetical protein
MRDDVAIVVHRVRREGFYPRQFPGYALVALLAFLSSSSSLAGAAAQTLWALWTRRAWPAVAPALAWHPARALLPGQPSLTLDPGDPLRSWHAWRTFSAVLAAFAGEAWLTSRPGLAALTTRALRPGSPGLTRIAHETRHPALAGRALHTLLTLRSPLPRQTLWPRKSGQTILAALTWRTLLSALAWRPGHANVSAAALRARSSNVTGRPHAPDQTALALHPLQTLLPSSSGLACLTAVAGDALRARQT